MLASLFNIPQDNNAMSSFSFANADAHRSITRAIFALSGLTLVDYILDPIPPFDPRGWLYRHQQAHNAQNSILGIAGNDLTTVDFNNKDETASWIWLHAIEHRQAAQLLGIT